MDLALTAAIECIWDAILTKFRPEFSKVSTDERPQFWANQFQQWGKNIPKPESKQPTPNTRPTSQTNQLWIVSSIFSTSPLCAVYMDWYMALAQHQLNSVFKKDELVVFPSAITHPITLLEQFWHECLLYFVRTYATQDIVALRKEAKRILKQVLTSNLQWNVPVVSPSYASLKTQHDEYMQKYPWMKDAMQYRAIAIQDGLIQQEEFKAKGDEGEEEEEPVVAAIDELTSVVEQQQKWWQTTMSHLVHTINLKLTSPPLGKQTQPQPSIPSSAENKRKQLQSLVPKGFNVTSTKTLPNNNVHQEFTFGSHTDDTQTNEPSQQVNRTSEPSPVTNRNEHDQESDKDALSARSETRYKKSSVDWNRVTAATSKPDAKQNKPFTVSIATNNRPVPQEIESDSDDSDHERDRRHSDDDDDNGRRKRKQSHRRSSRQ